MVLCYSFLFSKHCYKITSFSLLIPSEDRKWRIIIHPHFTEEGNLRV